MAMKPQTICKLQEGKLLSSFPHFVETWNWVVSCLENLKGDRDQTGSIVKDSEDEEGEKKTTTSPHGLITVSGLEEGRPVVSYGGSGGEGGGLARLVSGPDSNIVIQEVPDPEDESKTVTQIDVYYV